MLETLQQIFLVAVAAPITFVLVILTIKAYGFYRRERQHWQ